MVNLSFSFRTPSTSSYLLVGVLGLPFVARARRAGREVRERKDRNANLFQSFLFLSLSTPLRYVSLPSTRAREVEETRPNDETKDSLRQTVSSSSLSTLQELQGVRT